MRTTILVSRILRVIETEGSVGEGALLAEAYSNAVQQVNFRLESVKDSIDAKQVSDAVRMMEDAPRLLDEVSMLDFNQLPDWEALCTQNNWTMPLKLDKALLECVLVLNESTEVVEPFLRMYRKAVRMNNSKLAMQSLHRLVQIDHSQNWAVNLIQAEEAVLKKLVADFRAATSGGNIDEIDRLAQEFQEINWSETPTSKGVEEIRSYIAAKDEKQRNIEGEENISIIRRCVDGNWNRSLAFSMIQAIDGLVEKGFIIPPAQCDLIELCRKRCADEFEAEEKERRWKQLCEHLYAAIQQEDTKVIRDVLSAPEFLDKEPDEELIEQARLVILHEEANRKRKMLQIAVCTMVGLFAILGISGWWLKQKLFNDRCEGEAVKLTTLQNGAHSVERLSEALTRLKNEDPEVYADPRISVFDGILNTKRSQMNTRTNEIASILSELRALKEANWGTNQDSVTSRIERVNSIISKDDDSLRVEFLAIKAAWSEHCEYVAMTNRNVATRFHETLISHINVVINRLNSELISDDLSKEVASCKASVEEWKRIYALHAPLLVSAVDEAEMRLSKAEGSQHNLQTALKKLKESTTAGEFLESRESLVNFYSSYPFVASIGKHPIEVKDATAVISGSTTDQKAYKNMLKTGVDEATFKAFISDNVLCLADFPSYYSLYGIKVPRMQNYVAMCKGKPQISESSYQTYQVDGELLDLKKGEMTLKWAFNSKFSKPIDELLTTSVEIKNIVDIAAQPNITISRFKLEVLEIIDCHIKAAGANDFVMNEAEAKAFVVGYYPAIRRVQLLQMYFTWLKDDLKLMPQDREFLRWGNLLDELAQPVRIDGVPEDLTWTCLHDNRVRQRSIECAKLLSQMHSKNFIDEYRTLDRARIELRRIANWKFEYVGNNKFDPYDVRWESDHSVVIPSIDETVEKNHPLYILRRENGKLVLKRALIPRISEKGTGWAIEVGMRKEFVSGDPLFQVLENGKCIDAEEVIKGIFQKIPKAVAERFADKIPLFNVEVE